MKLQLPLLRNIALPLLVLAVACGPTATPTAPAAKTTSPPAAAPAGSPATAPAGSLATAPAGSPAAAASAAAKPSGTAAVPAEWDALVSAAKREGTVAVSGPAGADAQQALTKGFEARYGITVEFLGVSNRDLVPRLRSERAAGQYLWDVRVGGAIVDALPALQAIDPIKPQLLLPEVTDLRNWRGGRFEYSDKAEQILVMTPFQRGTLFVNPNNVNPEQFTSYRDLLDPKWKGKIAIDDPRNSGPGQATFTFFYMHPQLGPDFIRDLAKHDLTIMRDFPQEVDGVAQGRFQILVGTADFVVEQRAKQGVPVAIVDPTRLKEGSDVSPANGEVALFNRAPHPNAAKVYINWLLTKEGQTDFVRALGYVSNRVDVPTDHTFAWRIPKPDGIKTYTEEQAPLKEEKVLPLLRDLFVS